MYPLYIFIRRKKKYQGYSIFANFFLSFCSSVREQICTRYPKQATTPTANKNDAITKYAFSRASSGDIFSLIPTAVHASRTNSKIVKNKTSLILFFSPSPGLVWAIKRFVSYFHYCSSPSFYCYCIFTRTIT